MNPYLFELKYSTFRLVAPIVMGLSGLSAGSGAFPAVANWSNITSVFLTSALFAAPFFAGFSAWEALRSLRRNLTDTEATAAISLVAIRRPQYLAALTWTGACTAIVLITLIVRGGAIGLDGKPDFASLALPFIVNGFFITVGFATAEIVRRWLAVVISVLIVLGLYAYESFGAGPSWLKALNPLHIFSAASGEEPNALVFVGQMLVIAGVGFALMVAASRRSIRSLSTVALAALAVISVSFLGGALVYAQGGVNSRATPEEQLDWIELRTADGPVISVLSLYRPVQSDLASTWSRISQLTDTSGLRFSQLTQDLAPDYAAAPYPTFFRLDMNPLSDDIAAMSVEMAFNDIAACSTGQIPEGASWWLEGSVIVRTWFQGNAKFGSNVSFPDPAAQSALDALNSLSPADSQDWVKAHQDQIKTCAWNRTDFPST